MKNNSESGNAVNPNILENDINLITKSLSRPYFKSALKKLSKGNPQNARLICNYILDEQTEINLKESTKKEKSNY